ncbi:hypothetical protein RHS04_08676 [Rhizoctonia solani]|uniref:Uncharacterized protein n=1 Tax=Rhizoctonia solani TaxID=456999 RepID=A0A8H7H2L8_9AGAM|nr:hypothetical protein RHS04_08676 [Rhizoctonia solani]
MANGTCLLSGDANKDYPDLDPDMVPVFGYGQLDFIIVLTLFISKRFKIKKPELHILAHITKAHGAEGNAATDFVLFTKFGCSVILDVTLVKSDVGQVLTSGVKQLGKWYIIDHSLDMSETVFCPPKHAYEEGKAKN